jgi:hypothetical protein
MTCYSLYFSKFIDTFLHWHLTIKRLKFNPCTFYFIQKRIDAHKPQIEDSIYNLRSGAFQ